jgi:hypothetical protein
MSDAAPEYVAPRRVLLDALAALQDHLDSLILVGAQAVYHHAGEADLNVALMTTDADLAINAANLADAPDIGAVLRAAGFAPGPNPGHWVAPSDVAVDLMVVPHQAGTTKASARAARLASHEKLTARIAHGLEPALLDHEVVTVAALEPTDDRSFMLRVAGPAALLTAKAIKISERLGQVDTQPDRQGKGRARRVPHPASDRHTGPRAWLPDASRERSRLCSHRGGAAGLPRTRIRADCAYPAPGRWRGARGPDGRASLRGADHGVARADASLGCFAEITHDLQNQLRTESSACRARQLAPLPRRG